jgi:hypothetical protein
MWMAGMVVAGRREMRARGNVEEHMMWKERRERAK